MTPQAPTETQEVPAAAPGGGRQRGHRRNDGGNDGGRGPGDGNGMDPRISARRTAVLRERGGAASAWLSSR